MHDDDVELGCEQAKKGDGGAETNCDAHGEHVYLVVARRREVQGDKRQPHDTRRVHREADELGLVEGLWDLTRQDGVHCAYEDQEHRVGERHHVGSVDGSRAHQVVLVPCRVVVDGPRRT